MGLCIFPPLSSRGIEARIGKKSILPMFQIRKSFNKATPNNTPGVLTLTPLGCYLFILLLTTSLHAQEQKELKGDHFIVHYAGALTDDEARTMLRRAEEYYNSIAEMVGYARYSKFWTWDKRVTITVYPDGPTFTQKTGQPPWSQGTVERDWTPDRNKEIITFRQQENFFDGILPHEISHLILHDFIGVNVRVPRWFDEGVAQLQEKEKRQIAKQLMMRLVSQNKQPPLNVLMTISLKGEQNQAKIKIFYTQSLSVIDFLISRYGSESLGNLCRNMRDGKSFEAALTSAYPNNFSSLADLERKWAASLK